MSDSSPVKKRKIDEVLQSAPEVLYPSSTSTTSDEKLSASQGPPASDAGPGFADHAAAAVSLHSPAAATATTTDWDNSDAEYSVNEKLLRLMLKTKVDYFMNPEKTVFVCNRDDKMCDVWKGMLKHNFSAVPVLSKHEHRYHRFVDLANIVQHLIGQFNNETTRGEENFWKQVEEEKAFRQISVEGVLAGGDTGTSPRSERNPFNSVGRGYSILLVAELFACEPAMRHAPVVVDDHQLVNMVTQSQIINFLYQHKHLLGSKANQPLSTCDLVFKTVLTCHENDTAIDAFNTMVEANVSGLAMVNDAGELVGNLSLRDLKAVGYDLRLFWRFYQPCSVFVSKLESASRPAHVVYATQDDTLGQVLEKLASGRLHHMFIVSKLNHHPIGVISLSDLLKHLLFSS
jgi:CBS domain-containing protein